MKRRRRTALKPTVRPPRYGDDPEQTVRRLASQGHSGDVIAARLRLNKNTLRARHALDLAEGRELARAEADAAEAEQLSADEEIQRRAIFAGHLGNGGNWAVNGVSLLTGLTLPETEKVWAEWLRRSRAGNPVLPIILEAELFPEK